jgi:Na+/melibiose symporter-like transporter
VPVCVIAILLGRKLIPESRDPAQSALDPIGALLSIVALGGLLYGIIQAPDLGWGSGHVLGGIAVGAVVLATFLAWELHIEHPMLDIRIFANPRFSAASATITLTYFAMFGSTFLLTQYFQFVLGYSPLKAGLMTAPIAIGLMSCAPLAPRLVERQGSKRVVLCGLVIVLAALALYGCDTVMSNVFLGGLVRAMFGAGIALTVAPATESIMGSLPLARAGVGSAVNDTTRQTGGALGVAVLGSVFAARYHSVIGTAAVAPAAARNAVRDSIGTALDAAHGLSPAQGDAVRRLADHAALTGMRLAYLIGVAFVISAMVVCARYLPAHAAEPERQDDRRIGEALTVAD